MDYIKDKLQSVDEGRFYELINAMDVKGICANCHSFNYKVKETSRYRCMAPGRCIGITLDASLKSYLLWRVGLVTEKDHYEFIGI